MANLTIESVKAILGSRIQITEPGKYKVKVTAVTPYEDRNICNFNAMTPFHVSKTKEDLVAGELDKCLNHNMSSGQRMGKDFTPAKGDFVNIHVDFIQVKDSDELALLVTGVEEIKAISANKLSIDSWFDDEDAFVGENANAGLED